jgi:hypothetical protein
MGQSAATAEPSENAQPSAETEQSPPSGKELKGPRSAPPPGLDQEVAAKLARRDAQRREARRLLQEQVQNRTATLMSEIRNQLLYEIHNTLDDDGGPKVLKDVLEQALDSSFLRKLDADIDAHVSNLMERLRGSWRKEDDIESLLPATKALVDELQTYRDQLVRTHLLEQVEVYALPQLSKVFPEGGAPPEQLKRGIASYWKQCHAAIERFEFAPEKILLEHAPVGLRPDPSILRERLNAAQYRNGYRTLGARLADQYAKVAQLQMSKGDRLDKHRPEIDRQVVEGIIVPLAFFIRDRGKPEPLDAMRSRAELFRDIVDKMVASGDPFSRTAEAIKPILRRSIEQSRPQVLEQFPYLAAPIESLKPTEVHRATALLHMLETLLRPDLDEKALAAVEQNIRLNKTQYHIYVYLDRTHADLIPLLHPLDRIQPSDAEFFLKFLEAFGPTRPAIINMARRLNYLPPDQPAADDPQAVIQAIAVLSLPRRELTSWQFLYGATPPAPNELEVLAKTVVQQFRPTGIGAYDRQQSIGAVPVPVDLSSALASMGYHPDQKNRLEIFRSEIQQFIESGKPWELGKALENLRNFRRAVEEERARKGLVDAEASPYVGEIWLKESGEMVGLLSYRGTGFGDVPIELIVRKPQGANHADVEESLRRQLRNQALIYQAFHKLFTADRQLPLARRRQLPTYLKTTYEKIEPNRNALLIHLRNARFVLRRMEELAAMILESDPGSRTETATVAQILTGLSRKVDELLAGVDKTASPGDLTRFGREHERILKYLNVAIVQSVNPWLERQTSGLATEFQFREQDVEAAIRLAALTSEMDWDEVANCRVNPIRGTLGCRALLELKDGSSKVVLCEYDRREQRWKVRHFGPRILDVVREELARHGRILPEDYDEKFEQATFSLDEPASRFFLHKEGVARVEATLVLSSSQLDHPWQVVYLKWNDETLVDRANPLAQ